MKLRYYNNKVLKIMRNNSKKINKYNNLKNNSKIIFYKLIKNRLKLKR